MIKVEIFKKINRKVLKDLPKFFIKGECLKLYLNNLCEEKIT